jgi:hypothetical protein
MGTGWYATRESVKRTLDSASTARNDVEVDRALTSATDSVSTLCHRVFNPVTATRYFDWPGRQFSRPWRLWLDYDEVVSLTSLTAGGVAIAASDYFLEPVNLGPPFDRIEINLASASAFAPTTTYQRAIAATGVFGYRVDTAAAGTVAEVLDASETGVDVSDSSTIGVGSILLVDSERMIVTGRSMLTTAQTLQTPLTASNADVAVAVSTGSAYNVGEVILLDSERMLIVDIAANTLTVKRAYDGSVLATHAGSTIYAPRTLTVERGALGTTAASHLTAAPISLHVWPGLVNQLCIAEAVTELIQGGAGYARTIGSGEAVLEAVGKGLEDLRKRCFDAHGRVARMGAV